LSWCEVGRIDSEAGEAAVEGMAAGEAELGGGGVFEYGTCDVLQHASIEEGGEGSVEKDGEGGGGLLEKETVGEVFRGSTSQSENGIAEGECRGQGSGFKAAEVGFAVTLEELGNGSVGARLEMSIEVEEVPLQASREEAADGGFAGSHEAGENEASKVRGDGRGR
jgi:hypothetical protein